MLFSELACLWYRCNSAHLGLSVTNMTGWARKLVKFYNDRGTAERWIKEGKYAVK